MKCQYLSDLVKDRLVPLVAASGHFRKFVRARGFFLSPFRCIGSFPICKVTVRQQLRQTNLKKMIEIKGTQRCGRRRSSKKKKKKQKFVQNRPSLRIIDWFFTNFAKTKRIIINKKDVMHTYNRLLQTHKKTGFDMFSRRHFVLFRNPHSPSQILHTTAAQLHFFQFYIRQKIHSYIEQHLAELQTNMAAALKSARSRKMNANKRKRCTLVNASHQSNGYIITIDHSETTE